MFQLSSVSIAYSSSTAHPSSLVTKRDFFVSERFKVHFAVLKKHVVAWDFQQQTQIRIQTRTSKEMMYCPAKVRLVLLLLRDTTCRFFPRLASTMVGSALTRLESIWLSSAALLVAADTCINQRNSHKIGVSCDLETYGHYHTASCCFQWFSFQLGLLTFYLFIILISNHRLSLLDTLSGSLGLLLSSWMFPWTPETPNGLSFRKMALILSELTVYWRFSKFYVYLIF